MTSEFDMNTREWLVQKRTEEAVERVHQLAFADDLTAAESKLVWANVIAELVKSVQIERQSEATSEWLGLRDRR